MSRSNDSFLTNQELIAQYRLNRSPDYFKLLYERYVDKVHHQYNVSSTVSKKRLIKRT
ncbi:hypothetical protein [Spirosoma validum]|uniref:Uncharacterized protein n=1 Tax=Spirosoma validum TaxID=2771355 RepID=A0A927GGP0_9BACT|nr:hypothetical protein [Spirosoma validum]MBD2757192.1 hypothetical protein [Spirosoma validum]